MCCLDDNFTWIPCRHLIALACKESSFNFQTLPFKSRWQISFYTELSEEIDPDELPHEDEEINEGKENNGNIQKITTVILFV